MPDHKRLPWLRRLDESLTAAIFDDARHAQKWLAADPSTPLKAKLQAFIRHMYSVEDPRTLDEIIFSLNNLSRKNLGNDEYEDRVSADVMALLAKVFRGQSVPAGTLFGSLTVEQQQALKQISNIDEELWDVDDVMHSLLASYGFDFYKEEFEEFLAGKRESH